MTTKSIFWILIGTLFFVSCTKKSAKIISTSAKEKVEVEMKPITGKTPSGYTYIHHVHNNSSKAKIGDKIKYHNVVKKNQQVLISTYNSNAPHEIIIPGQEKMKPPIHPVWEGVQLMAIGDSMSIIQPVNEMVPIPDGLNANDTLFYEITVLSIISKEEVDKELVAIKAQEAAVESATITLIETYKNGTAKNIQTTDSGLKYIIHHQGEGTKVAEGENASVHYSGHLMDGSKFDNSFGRGEPINFPLGVGRVIPGWDEGIALLNKGGSATFFIPYQLAYGENGSPPHIPPKAELIFYVELKE